MKCKHNVKPLYILEDAVTNADIYSVFYEELFFKKF